jgi:hypothetical protein
MSDSTDDPATDSTTDTSSQDSLVLEVETGSTVGYEVNNPTSKDSDS